MATYNGEKFIAEQLNSILIQLGPHDEVIISDDGSTDRTIQIVQELNDKRIKIFYHIKNKFMGSLNSRNLVYATSNFENAIKKASGKYIFLSDQDDIWENNKVTKMIEGLKTYDLVMSNFSIINEFGETTSRSFFKKDPIRRSLFCNIITFRFQGCTMAFKKSILVKCIPFPNKLIAHDAWLGCLISFYGKYKFINEPLIKYRRYKSNVSTATGKSNNSIIFKISYRANFTAQILRRLFDNRMTCIKELFL